MQVLVSYTLDVKKGMTQEEVEHILDEVPPMDVPASLEDTFQVSTECWDICYS